MTLLVDTKLNANDVILFDDPDSICSSQVLELGVIVGITGRKIMENGEYKEEEYYLVRLLPDSAAIRKLPINARIYRISSLDSQDISEIRARILGSKPKESEHP